MKILIVTLIAGCLFASPLLAEDSLVDSLNLSRTQVKELRKTKEKNQKLRQHLTSKQHRKKRALQSELLKEDPNEERIKELRNDIASLNKEILDNNVNNIEEVRDILDKDQIEKIRRHRDEMDTDMDSSTNRRSSSSTRKINKAKKRLEKKRRKLEKQANRHRERKRNRDRINRERDND